jgi:hypothetical protein
MAYFIYNKNSNNEIYRIAADDVELSALNIPQNNEYLTISASQNDFDIVRIGNALISNYDGVSNKLVNISQAFDRPSLQAYINRVKNQISAFLNVQPQNIKFTQWNNYFTYLNSLNIYQIIPTVNGALNTSLETYINSQGQPYYSFLQIP